MVVEMADLLVESTAHTKAVTKASLRVVQWGRLMVARVARWAVQRAV